MTIKNKAGWFSAICLTNNRLEHQVQGNRLFEIQDRNSGDSCYPPVFFRFGFFDYPFLTYSRPVPAVPAGREVKTRRGEAGVAFYPVIIIL